MLKMWLAESRDKRVVADVQTWIERELNRAMRRCIFCPIKYLLSSITHRDRAEVLPAPQEVTPSVWVEGFEAPMPPLLSVVAAGLDSSSGFEAACPAPVEGSSLSSISRAHSGSISSDASSVGTVGSLEECSPGWGDGERRGGSKFLMGPD